MKKILFYLILFIFHVSGLDAQDIHFSQYNEQPSLINPALIGATDPSRASLGHRTQWRSITSPFLTTGASFETRFNSSNWQEVDKFRSMTFKERSTGRLASGISVFNDKSSDGKLGSTQVNISLSSFVPITEKSFFSVGIQASWVQKRLNNSNLVFPNQYNGSGYDVGLNSNETYQTQSYSYADLAVGILWTYDKKDKSLLGKRQQKAKLGFSIYHINQSDGNFLLNGKSDLYLKYVMHGDLLVSLPNPDFAIAPSYIIQLSGPSNELLVGLLVKRYFDIDSKYTGLIKRSSFGFGTYYRNNDAIILNTLLEIKEQWAIGVSYDINVSRLVRGTNARGGFELTLRYTPPNSFLYQKKKES